MAAAMNGLFSRSPSPGVVRLVVAGLLFGQVLAVILLLTPMNMASPRSLIILFALLSLGSLVAAIIGEGKATPEDKLRNRRRGA